jgi:hypothetical protein
VDWEGEKIRNSCLDLLEFFKTQYPEIPLTHFICPAYFARGEDLSKKLKRIRTLTQNDEIGLHIHCWKSLITESRVTPVLQPTLDVNDRAVPYGKGKEDTGFTIPLGVYSVAEIEKILSTGKQILAENELTTAENCLSFRCGAWLACDSVFTALQKAGFANDASGVPSAWISLVTKDVMPTFALWIEKLWGNKDTTTPKYLANTITHRAYPEGIKSCFGRDDRTISMPQVLENNILEIPDTGVLIDYTPPAILYYYIKQAWSLSEHQDIYISFGFHLESIDLKTVLSQNTPLLMALMQVLSKAAEDGITINYLKINQVRKKTEL